MRAQSAERQQDTSHTSSIGSRGNRGSTNGSPPSDPNLFTVRDGGIDRAAKIERPHAAHRPPRSGRLIRTRAAIALAAVVAGVAVVAGTHAESRDGSVVRESRHGLRRFPRPNPLARPERPGPAKRYRPLLDRHRGARTSFSGAPEVTTPAAAVPQAPREACGAGAEFGFETCRS